MIWLIKLHERCLLPTRLPGWHEFNSTPQLFSDKTCVVMIFTNRLIKGFTNPCILFQLLIERFVVTVIIQTLIPHTFNMS